MRTYRISNRISGHTICIVEAEYKRLAIDAAPVSVTSQIDLNADDVEMERVVFVVQNHSGEYWTGDCWGSVMSAEEYDTLGDLPGEIDGLVLEVHSGIDEREIDARYYEGDSAECSAKVRLI
jgi:hypothetical protein